MDYIKMIEKIGQEVATEDAGDFMSNIYEECGRAAGVDKCGHGCWAVNGRILKTYSGDPINDNIVQIAKGECHVG